MAFDYDTGFLDDLLGTSGGGYDSTMPVSVFNPAPTGQSDTYGLYNTDWLNAPTQTAGGIAAPYNPPSPNVFQDALMSAFQPTSGNTAPNPFAPPSQTQIPVNPDGSINYGGAITGGMGMTTNAPQTPANVAGGQVAASANPNKTYQSYNQWAQDIGGTPLQNDIAFDQPLNNQDLMIAANNQIQQNPNAADPGLLKTVGNWVTENQGLLSGLVSAGEGIYQYGNAQAGADAQAAAYQRAIDEQARQFDISQERMKPWLEAGTRGLGYYEDLMTDPASLRDLPAYQFQQGEGERAIMRGASAAGNRFSGNMYNALMERGQGLADLTYNQRLAQFGQLSGVGQGAASGLQALGSQYASDVGNAQIGQGAAQVSGYAGKGAAVGSGLANIGDIFGYQLNK